MTRAPLLIGAIASLLFGAGCGGGQSELCHSLGDLQDTIQGAREIELGEDALDEFQQAADELNTDIAAVKNAAGEELGPEVAAFEASVQALVADVEAAVAQGEITRESVSALGGSVSAAASAFQALRESAPDCDL